MHVFASLMFILLSFLCGWYLYFRYCYTYWKRKGVPFIQPTFPVGNILPILLKKENVADWTANVYKHFKDQGQRHGGIYFLNQPIYFPVDPNIIKSITVKNCDKYFPSHGVRISTKTIPPLARNIFVQSGQIWKEIRAGLNPAFTPAKIKNAYIIFTQLADSFLKVMENTSNNGEVDVNKIAINHSVDMLVNAALGLESNAHEDPTNKIYEAFKKVGGPPKLLDVIKVALRNKGLKSPVDLFELVFRDREIEEFFIKITKEIIKLRDDGKVVRDDFTNTLLKLRKHLGLTLDDISGQIYFLYVAGHATTATAITFALHSLAHHNNVQKKLRKEIFQKLGTDIKNFSYEALTALPYLDAVIKGIDIFN